MRYVFWVLLTILTFQPRAGYADSLINRALHAPSNVSNTKRELVHYLVRDLNDDYDKLKVIAYWIASHIAYDGYKYNDTSGVNEKEYNYRYDVFKKRVGICSDYADLFSEMANIANAGRISNVHGYVLENVTMLKRTYREREVKKLVAHEWNKVELQDGRKFFVDTTFMSGTNIYSGNSKRVSSLNHKMDINKRGRANNVNTNIDDFYFDFTPKKEVKDRHILHLQSKYIR